MRRVTGGFERILQSNLGSANRAVESLSRHIPADLKHAANKIQASLQAEATRMARTARSASMHIAASEIEARLTPKLHTRIQAESASLPGKIGLKSVVWDTLNQAMTDARYSSVGLVRTAQDKMRLVEAKPLEKEHFPIYGFDLNIESAIVNPRALRESIEAGGFTPHTKTNLTQTIGLYMDEWYAEFYARVFNLFYQTLWEYTNPFSGKTIRSARISSALGVQFVSPSEVHIGLFGNRYLRWMAYKLEEGGDVRPKKAKAMAVRSPRLPKIESPPWRRARLYRNALLIIWQGDRAPNPTDKYAQIGVIAEKSGRKITRVLYSIHKMIHIDPKHFWSDTIRVFNDRFARLRPRIDTMTTRTWDKFERAYRKRGREVVRLKRRTARRAVVAVTAEKVRPTYVPMVPADTGPRDAFRLKNEAIYKEITGVVTAADLKHWVRRARVGK